MAEAAKHVKDDDFEATVIQAQGPVLVDFWAEWCGPCKMIGPVLEELASEMAGKITICKVNVDESPKTPSQYGLRSVPTLMIFKDGKLTATKVGAATKQSLQGWIEENL